MSNDEAAKRAVAAPVAGGALRPLPAPAALEAPFIAHAAARVAELRAALRANSAVRVTVAGHGGRHSLGVDLAVGQSNARWPASGDAARRRYVAWLQQAFDALGREFPRRVEFGWLDRAQASRTHYLVWGA